MTSGVILFGWNRSIPGREKVSAAHFQEFVAYLTGLQQKGNIAGFDVIFLDVHGGDLNGFCLIRGDIVKLDAVLETDEWNTHITRATLHLENAGVIRGVTGDEIQKRMAMWINAIPA
jgi:hypothetical protein